MSKATHGIVLRIRETEARESPDLQSQHKAVTRLWNTTVLTTYVECECKPINVLENNLPKVESC